MLGGDRPASRLLCGYVEWGLSYIIRMVREARMNAPVYLAIVSHAIHIDGSALIVF